MASSHYYPSIQLFKLPTFSIIYQSEPFFVFFIDDIHRTELLTKVMSFLVAYISLARTAPNHEKERGREKGSGMRRDTWMRFKTPNPGHEPIFKVYTVKIARIIWEATTANIFSRSRVYLAALHIHKSCLTAGLLSCTSHFISTYEILMLMKESLEIKGKTLEKDLYYERPFDSSNENKERNSKKRFRSVHRVWEYKLREKYDSSTRKPLNMTPSRVGTLSQEGKGFININMV
ncbi:hypothetical protein K435DRAFT_838804 [Dendrothele bispora CBS 962.96]|uniref:Uncharacterized protein n=1 Tax=Dendrothele bispora (strain CBS 962.96) TaxID=1314807 RepID=A0A4S8M4V8_DENBC|nr:hypothetical protein K435DRAFT_838804 [Dendrothele bispora CBS 962.96]